jgi:hypothetical protein
MLDTFEMAATEFASDQYMAFRAKTNKDRITLKRRDKGFCVLDATTFELLCDSSFKETNAEKFTLASGVLTTTGRTDDNNDRFLYYGAVQSRSATSLYAAPTGTPKQSAAVFLIMSTGES